MPCAEYGSVQDVVDMLTSKGCPEAMVKEFKAVLEEAAAKGQQWYSLGTLAKLEQKYGWSFDGSCPLGWMPNPAFSPIQIGGKFYFTDDKGLPHAHASGAAEANMEFHSITGGNCGQVPADVPDYVRNPNYRK